MGSLFTLFRRINSTWTRFFVHTKHFQINSLCKTFSSQNDPFSVTKTFVLLWSEDQIRQKKKNKLKRFQIYPDEALP